MKQIIARLLRRTPASLDRNRKIRGLSTAELVGIIVIVGILGALGGTYINGLVTQANDNTGKQNATTLNTLANSIFAQGATVGTGANQFDTSTAAKAIAALNAGVSVNGVTFAMSPTIAAGSIASYGMTGAGTTTPVFSFTLGDAP